MACVFGKKRPLNEGCEEINYSVWPPQPKSITALTLMLTDAFCDCTQFSLDDLTDTGEFVIGRSRSSDCRITDLCISSAHAAISIEKDSLIIEDLSSGGTDLILPSGRLIQMEKKDTQNLPFAGAIRLGRQMITILPADQAIEGIMVKCIQGDPDMMGQVWFAGRQKRQRKVLTFGRSHSNTVRVNAESVSASHCSINSERGFFVLEDTESTHGTHVIGRCHEGDTRDNDEEKGEEGHREVLSLNPASNEEDTREDGNPLVAVPIFPGLTFAVGQEEDRHMFTVSCTFD